MSTGSSLRFSSGSQFSRWAAGFPSRIRCPWCSILFEGGAVEYGDFVGRHAVDGADVEGGEVVGADEFGVGGCEADGLEFDAVFHNRKLAAVDSSFEVVAQAGDAIGTEFSGCLRGLRTRPPWACMLST